MWSIALMLILGALTLSPLCSKPGEQHPRVAARRRPEFRG